MAVIYWLNEIISYIALGLIIFWNQASESENIKHKKYIEAIIFFCAITSATSFSLQNYIGGTLWALNFSIWIFHYKNMFE